MSRSTERATRHRMPVAPQMEGILDTISAFAKSATVQKVATAGAQYAMAKEGTKAATAAAKGAAAMSAAEAAAVERARIEADAQSAKTRTYAMWGAGALIAAVIAWKALSRRRGR